MDTDPCRRWPNLTRKPFQKSEGLFSCRGKYLCNNAQGFRKWQLSGQVSTYFWYSVSPCLIVSSAKTISFKLVEIQVSQKGKRVTSHTHSSMLKHFSSALILKACSSLILKACSLVGYLSSHTWVAKALSTLYSMRSWMSHPYLLRKVSKSAPFSKRSNITVGPVQLFICLFVYFF